MPNPTPARPEEAIARVREVFAIAAKYVKNTDEYTLVDVFTPTEYAHAVVTFGDLRALLAYADALKNANQYHADRANLAEQERERWRQQYADAVKSGVELATELAALRERLARAEQDTARLDWLAERYTDYDRWLGVYYADYGFSDLRKSVDAARRPDPTEGTPDPTPARLPGDAHGGSS